MASIHPAADEGRGPNPVDKFVGLKVRSRRKVLGVSQEKLAEALGVTFQQVQKYERGANRISASRLFAIAETLAAPIAFFFEGLQQGAHASSEVRQDLSAEMVATAGGLEMMEVWIDLDPGDRHAVLTNARAFQRARERGGAACAETGQAAA